MSKRLDGDGVGDRMVRSDEIEGITGLNSASIRRLESLGQFPKRRKIGLRAVGWLASEIRMWIESRKTGASS